VAGYQARKGKDIERFAAGFVLQTIDKGQNNRSQ
jgi:hypothetical protein